MSQWSLKRTKQCAKCPWKKTTDPHTIPRGYSVKKHKALQDTIAQGASLTGSGKAMACHETHDAHCLGWLINQLQNNNIPLRMKALFCSNLGDVELNGPQHERFKDTLPVGCEP